MAFDTEEMLGNGRTAKFWRLSVTCIRCKLTDVVMAPVAVTDGGIGILVVVGRRRAAGMASSAGSTTGRQSTRGNTLGRADMGDQLAI